MRIIEPSYEILTVLDPEKIMKHLELCGRVCYKSEDKITADSADRFIKSIIDRGHEAVLEHYSFSVRFIVDRGVSHEIVRHRLASYCQESTRYCNYADNKYGHELTFIRPPCFQKSETEWSWAMGQCEYVYFNMLAHGRTPQEARSVLPNSLKTELIMTANIREWRHFLALRTASDTHPQMRQVAIPLLGELQEKLPVLFRDIEVI